jgi:hypothetical protein
MDIDPHKLVRQAIEQATEKPQMTTLAEYMLAYTDNDENLPLKLAPEYDLEKVTYQGEVGDALIFIDVGKQPMPMKASDYKEKWVAVDSKSIVGSMLLEEYEKLVKMAYEQIQVPPEWKGKIFIK